MIVSSFLSYQSTKDGAVTAKWRLISASFRSAVASVGSTRRVAVREVRTLPPEVVLFSRTNAHARRLQSLQVSRRGHCRRRGWRCNSQRRIWAVWRSWYVKCTTKRAIRRKACFHSCLATHSLTMDLCVGRNPHPGHPPKRIEEPDGRVKQCRLGPPWSGFTHEGRPSKPNNAVISGVEQGVRETILVRPSRGRIVPPGHACREVASRGCRYPGFLHSNW